MSHSHPGPAPGRDTRSSSPSRLSCFGCCSSLTASSRGTRPTGSDAATDLHLARASHAPFSGPSPALLRTSISPACSPNSQRFCSHRCGPSSRPLFPPPPPPPPPPPSPDCVYRRWLLSSGRSRQRHPAPHSRLPSMVRLAGQYQYPHLSGTAWLFHRLTSLPPRQARPELDRLPLPA